MGKKEKVKKTDDLTRLCNELEEWKKKGLCNIDEISYIRSKLKEYINGDKNKALKLKAQIEIKKNEPSEDSRVALSIYFLNIFILILTQWFNYQFFKSVAAGCWMLMIVGLIVLLWDRPKIKYGYQVKWRQYIAVVLNDMYP